MLVKIFNGWIEKFTTGNRFLARMITVWIAIASLGLLIYFIYGVYVLRHIRVEFPDQNIARFFPGMALLLLFLVCLVFLEVKFLRALRNGKP